MPRTPIRGRNPSGLPPFTLSLSKREPYLTSYKPTARVKTPRKTLFVPRGR